MATAPQTAMDMPQEAGANPFADPNTMAVYDQLRQTMSPKEFGDEMLAGASQVDPEAMAQFREELSQIDLSPEDLDMLNNMVDEILATPEQYAAVRAKYLEMGAPEELLPEEFDPQFFAAMNMAVDQLIAEPAGVQAFAMGGIAELKPIAKAIAGYGRNGDTMLAHITPAEARMLRRRGGSGTINPATGLPEFFLKKAFKSLGKAIKSFASSTVGKIVTTVALGFFLGPAAAGLVGATSAAGVAAVSGFVGGAGSTLLGGGNLKDALKAGAIGGLTAGVTTGVTQGFGTAYQGPTTISGQVDRFTNFVNPSATASGVQAPAIDASGNVKGIMPTDGKPVFQSGVGLPEAQTSIVGDSINPTESQFTPKKISLVAGPDGTLQVPPGSEVRPFTDASGKATSMGTFPTDPPYKELKMTGMPVKPFDAPYNPTGSKPFPDFFGSQPSTAGVAPPGMADVTTNTARDLTRPAISDPLSSFTDKIKSGYNEYFSPSNIQAQGATDALSTVKAQFPGVTTEQIMNAPASSALGKAYASAMPGIFSTYAPITALGLGAVGLAGGFKATDAQPSAMRDELMKPVTQRIAEGGNQRNFYMQGLPGVKYDQYGAPIFGQNVPLPTFDTGLGIQSLINPKAFAAGGAVTAANFDETAYLNANPDVKAELAKLEGRGSFKNAFEHYSQYGQAEGRTAFDKTETAAKAVKDAAEKEAAQIANRKLVEDAKAAKKAAGVGDAYKNINAGLSYDVPAGIAATSIAARQAAFKPTMDRFTQPQPASGSLFPTVNAPAVVSQPYNNASGYGNFINKPVLSPVNYNTTPVVATPPPAEKKLMNMGGIASLGAGGYPRRTGQINGPGTATSDSIPAMLSDGEFVMTAKAVRGAGKGNRRAGAKRMYALMNQLEKNAARG